MFTSARDKRDVVFVIRHDKSGDLFAAVVVRQADDAHFFDKSRFAVKVLDLVRINVLAVRIDDDVL